MTRENIWIIMSKDSVVYDDEKSLSNPLRKVFTKSDFYIDPSHY